MTVRIIIGDALEQLRLLPAGSVHSCVTSPPYYGLRAYLPDGHEDKHREIGLEATPSCGNQGECGKCYLCALVAVFREVRRVLRPDGVMFLNIGDSYMGGGPHHGDKNLGKSGTNKGSRTGVDRASSRRERLCGTSDTALSGSRRSGSTSTRLCDACREAVTVDCSTRNNHSPDVSHSLSPFASSPAHMEFSPGRLATLGSPAPAGRSEGAIPDSPLVADHEPAPLLVVRPSTSLEYDQPLPVGCSRCGNCGACLLVLASSSRDALACACRSADALGMTDCTAGSASPSEEPQRHNRHTLVSDSIVSTYPYSTTAYPKPKDLLGIPWMLAFALRADGWYLRQDIIWAKPNPMPESVTDRCTKAHEYIFLLSKSERYWFDAAAIAEPGQMRPSGQTQHKYIGDDPLHRTKAGFLDMRAKVYERVNKRSVWTVASQAFPESHFATFPPALIEPAILAGCPRGGVVLDPFAGAGTTGLVADRLGRDATLIELNPLYAGMAERRIWRDGPLFADVAIAAD